jgi:hypothetical protein
VVPRSRWKWTKSYSFGKKAKGRTLHRMKTLEPSDSEEYNDEALDDGDGDLANPIGVKYLYRDST